MNKLGKVVEKSFFSGPFQESRSQSKIVFTNGCFDILHVGHVRYLQEAKSQGDVLVVGVNSDSSVKRLKGEERPIQTEQDRAEVLAALDCVDYVGIFTEDTADNIIKAVRPNIYVKGGDWSVDQIKEAPTVLEMGGEVKSLPFHKGRSTTNIVQKIIQLG